MFVRCFFILYCACFFLKAFAGVDDIERFKKCYALFTSHQVSLTHPLMVDVLTSRKSGTQACADLLASVNLNSQNTINKDSQGKYPREKQRILRNINFWHKAFFTVLSYDALPIHVNLDPFSPNLFDYNSDSYYWTYAFFKPGVKASSVITDNHSYLSKRESETPVSQKARNINSGIPFDENRYGGWKGSIKTQFVDQGRLVGIEKDNRIFYANLADNFHSGEMEGSNANKHFGSGVIGSQVYLFGNMGRHGQKQRSNGGDKVYRVWSRNVLKDMLCKDLPALRVSDVTSEVDIESPFFFRKSSACMQCHSSMDPMAGYIGNVRTTGISGSFRPYHAFQYTPTKPALPGILPKEEEIDFHLRTPVGRLMYRSYDGRLMNNSSSAGLPSLGAEIAKSDDYYACIVKKYYQKMTGISVNLNDITTLNLSSIQKKHRDRVISFGQQLKNDPNQNIQKIIKDIIDTPTFIKPERF